MRRHLCAFLVGLAVACATEAPVFAQETAEEFTNRLIAKMRTYQANPETAELGYLTGIWEVNPDEHAGDDIQVVQISHMSDVLIESVLDTDTGDLSPVGFAEQSGGSWSGWFSLACRECCPGHGWWDRGVVTVDRGKKALRMRSDTKKMDPDECVLTEEPDVVDIDMKLIKVMSFKEYLPGKLIHIVAAPAVGNQRAQYKASVTPKWDISGYGVASVSLGVRSAHGGQWLLRNSSQIAGAYEFLTDRSGEYFFLFSAFNAKGQPLHFEIESVEIPPIPGIGG